MKLLQFLFYKNKKEAAKVAEWIGTMTHNNPESIEAVKFYVDTVHNIVHETGNPWYDIGGKFTELNKENPYREPSGYVKDTLTYVLSAMLAANTFEDAIIASINMGGDADTIGAITGGIAGAWYGYDNIPQRWIDALDEDVKKILDEATDAAIENQE